MTSSPSTPIVAYRVTNVGTGETVSDLTRDQLAELLRERYRINLPAKQVGARCFGQIGLIVWGY
jgi:hypothetical protein